MGNEVSGRRSDDEYSDDDTITDNGKRSRRSRGKNKNEDDNAAAYLIDTVCSNFTFYSELKDKKRRNSFGSFSDEDDDDESLRGRGARKNRQDSFADEYSFEGKKKSRRGRTRSRRNDDDTTLDGDDETQEESVLKDDDRGSLASASDVPSLLSKPLASSFAKKCYFTKAGIGKKSQHYEGLVSIM